VRLDRGYLVRRSVWLDDRLVASTGLNAGGLPGAVVCKVSRFPDPNCLAAPLRGRLNSVVSPVAARAVGRQPNSGNPASRRPCRTQAPDKASFAGVLRGFWLAHIGWFFEPDPTDMGRYAKDLRASRVLRVASALFPIWIALGLVIPAVLVRIGRRLEVW
jgi:hypothetical protein